MQVRIVSLVVTTCVSAAAWSDPPVLSPVATEMTVLESQVQDDNFFYPFSTTGAAITNTVDGATLLISGMVANQDHLNVVSGGEGEDAIVADAHNGGFDLFYGGVEIGRQEYPVYDVHNLRVNFNAAATPAAVQAVLRNIAYNNSHPSPTAQRFMRLRFVDGAGERAQGALFTGLADEGQFGPFDGIDVGYVSEPEFFDLDADGDFDLIVGENAGIILYFLNTGDAQSPAFVRQEGSANPFAGIQHGLRGSPALGDIDGDGDADLVFADHTGALHTYENTGTPQAPVFTQRTGDGDPLAGVDVGDVGHPALADLNGDGKPELVVASWINGIFYFENNTAGESWVFDARTGDSNPFSEVASARDMTSLSIDVNDFDGDGDHDAIVVAPNLRRFLYLRNDGTAQSAQFSLETSATNPFGHLPQAGDQAPALTDVDGDGDVDLVLGLTDGRIYFHAFGTQPGDIFTTLNISPENDAPRFQGSGFGTNEDAVLDLENFLRAGGIVVDDDGDAWTITDYDASATQADVREENGRLIYAPSPTYNYLCDGRDFRDTIAVTVTDAHGATASRTLQARINGINDPLTANSETLTISEDEPLFNVHASILANETDPDEAACTHFTVTSVRHTGVRGDLQRHFFDGFHDFGYTAAGNFDALAVGESATDVFSYTASDGFVRADAVATIIVTGVNDAPIADSDAVSIGYRVPERDITDTVMSGDSDVDNGALIRPTAIVVDPTVGLVRIAGGRILFTPPNGINSPARDSFRYRIADEHGAVSEADVSIQYLPDSVTYALSVSGAGEITTEPLGAVCSTQCETDFAPGTSIQLIATGRDGTQFLRWTGYCEGEASPVCVRTLHANAETAAVFGTPDLLSAVLPAARSGALGGTPLSIFATVLNAGNGAATGCTVALQDGAAASLVYRAVDAANAAVGPDDPVFTIPENGQQSFVLSLTPLRTTTGNGEATRVLFSCANAEAPSVLGVNSVFLTISNSAVPDIIAIGATPTADGSLRIADHGGRQAMSAAAVNIGSPGDILVTMSNGAGELPAGFSICQSDSSGVCLAPRTSNLTLNMGADPVLFSILAVDEDGAQSSIPDDPANARLYLRFLEPTGEVRGLTSVGVASGPPLDLDPARDARPFGRWISLLARSGDRSVRQRGVTFSLPSGAALLATDDAIVRFDASGSNYNARRRNFTGAFTHYAATGNTSGTLDGYWFPRRAVQATLSTTDETFSLSAVYDRRSTQFDGIEEFGSFNHIRGTWTLGQAALEGPIGEWTGTLTIDPSGNVSGTLGGCIASGALASADANARGVQPVSLTLTACSDVLRNGVGEGVIYVAVENERVPYRYLLMAWDNAAMRSRMVPQE